MVNVKRLALIDLVANDPFVLLPLFVIQCTQLEAFKSWQPHIRFLLRHINHWNYSLMSKLSSAVIIQHLGPSNGKGCVTHKAIISDAFALSKCFLSCNLISNGSGGKGTMGSTQLLNMHLGLVCLFLIMITLPQVIMNSNRCIGFCSLVMKLSLNKK